MKDFEKRLIIEGGITDAEKREFLIGEVKKHIDNFLVDASIMGLEVYFHCILSNEEKRPF